MGMKFQREENPRNFSESQEFLGIPYQRGGISLGKKEPEENSQMSRAGFEPGEVLEQGIALGMHKNWDFIGIAAPGNGEFRE